MNDIETSFVTGHEALAALAREAGAAHLEPAQLEHDPRWLAATDHGDDAEGLALALRRGGALAGYVPIRRRKMGLPLRIGEVKLASLPCRALQLFGRGVLGDGEELAEAALGALGRATIAYDAVTLEETPLDSPLWRAAHDPRVASAFVPTERTRSVHHVVELPGSFAAYFARFSSKTRNSLGRKQRKLEAELGALALETYAGAAEMRPMLERIGPVATKTYHYRLLGQDLTVDNARLLANLERWASRGWVRGYVLAANGAAVAYVVGFLVGRRFFYELLGYDPAHAAFAPGTVLLVRLLEDLAEHRIADVLDFGAGDADYKRLFGTASWEEGSMLLARRTVYARSAAGIERAFAGASRVGAAALERLGVKRRVKGFLRARAGEAETG